MFTIKHIPLDNTSLRVFADTKDEYVALPDFRKTFPSFGKGQRLKCFAFEELKAWTIDQGLFPAVSEKPLYFVRSAVWLKLLSEEQVQQENSSESSSSQVQGHVLPQGVPEWVMSAPNIPAQFSRDDYTKAYALKPYDLSRPLKKELKKIAKWWTQERNVERTGKAIGTSTADKREERMLCFLGFVNSYKCLREDQLTLALYLNCKLFEAYLNYLQEVRQSSHGTIGEAITAAISACVWLYRKERNAKDAQIIRRYKDWRNIHQAKAIRERKHEDVEELQLQNRWLEWTDFTELVGRLRQEWTVEQEQGPSVHFAQQLHDLLLLGIYSCIPARGAEVRLLQYLPEESLELENGLKKWVEKEKINLLTCLNGVWKTVLSQYKNFKSAGVDCTELSQFQWWTDLFSVYFTSYRPLLVKEANHAFVFVTRGGEPFTDNYFSDFLSNLLFRHTNKRLATNILRSSFVTYFYNSDKAQDPVMRESVANVMRHSVAQAQKTYDRRTATQKKRQGLSLLSDVQLKQHAPSRLKVVQFERRPHQVMQEENGRFLLARMERSPSCNAPVYFVPANAKFEWKPSSECQSLSGDWNEQEDEFTLH